MSEQIKIGTRIVERNGAPFIVAEAGINHNGDVNTAFRMIEAAKQAGVDAIKFQTFIADEFVGDPNQTYTYNSQGKEVTESMLEMFRRYEFSREEWFAIKEKCDAEKILFLSTPQNYSDLKLLLELGITAIKVGSDDFTNLPLLRSYADTGLPLIISCGMADLAEVYTSLNTVGAFNGYPVILLLCTSQYPTPENDVNLLKLRTLSNAFPHLSLGFSDHTQGSLASSLAVAFGACFFEKHFTLNHDLPGPDHWFSENPESLKVWSDSIRSAFRMLGDPIVKPTAAEEKMKVLARRSIIALKDIEEGEVLSVRSIGLRRPGNGMAPVFFNDLLDKMSTRSIQKGSLLQWGDFK